MNDIARRCPLTEVAVLSNWAYLLIKSTRIAEIELLLFDHTPCADGCRGCFEDRR